MDKVITFRIDQETLDDLEQTSKQLKISKSDVVRMAISHFKNYVEKVNK